MMQKGSKKGKNVSLAAFLFALSACTGYGYIARTKGTSSIKQSSKSPSSYQNLGQRICTIGRKPARLCSISSRVCMSRTGEDSSDGKISHQSSFISWIPSHFPVVGAQTARRLVAGCLLPITLLLSGPMSSFGDDELARYAAEGNKVGVDTSCFTTRCNLQFSRCINNPDCLKGLTCLAKCKGDSMCSTGCFSKFGNPDLDDMLYCAVEKEDCVHVPRDESRATWDAADPDAPPYLVRPFDAATLGGAWYKVLGLDSRYDCFDCQVNTFTARPDAPGKVALPGANLLKEKEKAPKPLKPGYGPSEDGADKDQGVMDAEIRFRMPRIRSPGYYENNLSEEMVVDPPGAPRTLHTVGRMFGLTFWENWYIIGENDPGNPEEAPWKFVYYTGHTLQGNYKGAFVYAKEPAAPASILPGVQRAARRAGLDPNGFCQIRNQCFEQEAKEKAAAAVGGARGGARPVKKDKGGVWFLGAPFFTSTKDIAVELADWFEDPTYLSEWLVDQQERMVLTQPLAVSPFAGTPLEGVGRLFDGAGEQPEGNK
mmetsp:Transcript_8279/g.14621  ORF Transcript_8279/g.14621 Transcript_8279/m.14621 type:complete len:540 (+) Transcript_8279:186-1805(+)